MHFSLHSLSEIGNNWNFKNAIFRPKSVFIKSFFSYKFNIIINKWWKFQIVRLNIFGITNVFYNKKRHCIVSIGCVDNFTDFLQFLLKEIIGKIKKRVK